ncbi:hypothetical protein DD238_003391 [Peronospora effusa]|uniref:Ketoreductase domain-containing protein n=1 Tax=Peronospora effusa TaxID=542832 RepID=A0A3M6VVG9_9STRA|nr:hypothetical protein DD238_003391 [Peronospora effusa]
MMLVMGVTSLVVLWVLVRVIQRRVFTLDNKVVVITGAGNGIGRSLARKIFTEADNVTVALLDIDMDALEKLQTELLQSKHDKEDKQVLMYESPKHIEVLVNNAVLTPEQIQKTFAVNTLAHFWTLKTALSSMKKAPEALLVTVSSVMGMMSSAGLTDYCASKAAVNAFHEAVRLELWHDNVKSIRTLLICPAAVDTGMFAGALAANDWALKISRFCIPMLSESEVADTIYRAMRNGDEEVLVSCFSGWRRIVLSWAPSISRLLPVRLYDVVVRLGGGLNGMDTFVGKNGGRGSEKEKAN